MSLTTPQATFVLLYAGFWRRVAASSVDCLILVIAVIVIDVVFAKASILAFLINVVIGCAYYAGFHSSAKQATPGKMAFGVKVSDLAGARIGVVRGIGRYFATWLSAFILGIGYLMAAFTEKKRALHDMIAGTLVVNAKADSDEIVARGGVMPVTAGVWVVSVLLIVIPFFGGILAGIMIPAYQDYTVRAKIVQALTEISVLRSEIQQAYAQKQPFRTGSIQVASPSVKSVAVNSIGVIVITLVPEVAGGGSIVYTPSIDSAGMMSWRCSSGGVPPKYLPTDCRQ
jgi:uncharacterized RDD family membrane protein YckC/Tfp pilus assembly major pilin PilA